MTYTCTAQGVSHPAFTNDMPWGDALRFASWCRGQAKRFPEHSEQMLEAATQIEAGARHYVAKAVKKAG